MGSQKVQEKVCNSGVLAWGKRTSLRGKGLLLVVGHIIFLGRNGMAEQKVNQGTRPRDTGLQQWVYLLRTGRGFYIRRGVEQGAL